MAKKIDNLLSGRERQIMDIIFKLGEATASEVLENLPDNPNYSTVRALLRILESKGHLQHKQDGPRYVFYPTVSRERAGQAAIKHLLTTFFNNSVEGAVATLLDVSKNQLSDTEFERLRQLIEQKKTEGI